MQYRTLKNIDFPISAIGLGCVTFGREIDADAAYAVLDHAWEQGINLLDTARVYGGEESSEQIIGRWLRKNRLHHRVLVATKVSGDMSGPSVALSVQQSLDALGVPALDLLQLHQFPQPPATLAQTLQVLQEQVEAGQVRHLGVSNFTGDQLQQALAIQRQQGWKLLATIQPIYNLVHRELETDLWPVCRQEGIGLLTYSPLGAGFLTGKYRPGASAPAGTRFDIKPGHQRIYFGERGFKLIELLRGLSERSGRTMANLALAWAFSRPEPTCVLVGARGPAQVDQALAAWRQPLPAEIMQEMNGW